MFGLFKKKPDHYTVTLQGETSVSFKVKRGTSLLNAALEAGLNWPFKCKVGSCATCRCKKIDGKYKANINFAYAMKPEQVEQGYILACQSEPRSDMTVEVKLFTDEQAAKNKARILKTSSSPSK